MSEGVINYRVPQLIDGKVTTLEIVKHGPVCFMVTTTKAALHAENETRMISLEVDDSEAQTERVLRKIAATVGRNMKPDQTEYHRWQDFQRLLRILGKRRPDGWQVDVPFADDLSELISNKRAVRLRRDFSQILMAIKAHALIHLYKRETNSRGEIVADLDLDYGVIRPLLDDIMAEASGVAVKTEVQETIAAVKIATADPSMPKDDGATAYEVAKILHLDKSSGLRRLRVAAEKGFVVNMETRRGQPGKYRVTDQEVEHEPLLPLPIEIRASAEIRDVLSRRGVVKNRATVQPKRRIMGITVARPVASGLPPVAWLKLGRTRRATAHATATSMRNMRKSPQVARLRENQGWGVRERKEASKALRGPHDCRGQVEDRRMERG